MLMTQSFNRNELLVHKRLFLAVQYHLQKLCLFSEDSITFLKPQGHHKDNAAFQEIPLFKLPTDGNPVLLKGGN